MLLLTVLFIALLANSIIDAQPAPTTTPSPLAPKPKPQQPPSGTVPGTSGTGGTGTGTGATGATQSQAKELGGGKFRQISAKQDGLWGVTIYNQAVFWNGKEWEYANFGLVEYVGAGPETDKTNMIASDISLHAWRSKKKGWDRVGAGVFAFNVNGGEGALQVSLDGCLWKYSKAGVLEKLPGHCDVLQGSIGVDDKIWKVDQNREVAELENGRWFYENRPEKLDNAKGVEVQSKDRVVIYDEQNVYVSGKALGEWNTVDFGVHCAQATIGATKIYCLSDQGLVYQLEQ